MNDKHALRKMILVIVTVALTLSCYVPVTRVQALEQSSWGRFAEDYGRRYLENHPEARVNPPAKGSYGETVAGDYGTAIYAATKEKLSEKLKKKCIELFTAGDRDLLNQAENLVKWSYKHIPQGRRTTAANKLWRAENNMFKQGVTEAKEGIKKGTGQAIRFVNVLFFLWGAYEYLVKEDKVTYKSPFFQFCADVIGASAVLAVFIPVYGWVYTAADVAVNSDTMKKYVNESSYGQTRGFLDDLTDFNNEQWQNLWEPIMYYWYRGQIEANELELIRMQKESRGASFTANGVNVYKPNIYLYPEKETDVYVQFDLPELLTVSDPEYGNGWQVSAAPDGTLNVEGNEYGYLFYESLTYPWPWQRNDGFHIPAEAREETFREILSAYGLNHQEIDDFIEFWGEKLEPGHDYAMYPQTDVYVNEAMPVNITPEPDSILRLWFAFVKDEQPERKAVIDPFSRDGFSVVEWGGFILE